MNSKCVSITWLSKVDLSNINSGEGGGGNVVELKTYRAGKRPYASGQSVRHALREAVERGNPGCFTSTPEAPSCDIARDWLCDLFGYLNPKKGEGADRRWSPIKVTPALGQVDCEIVTDLILRMSDLDKSDESAARDQRLAYVQLAENIFRTGLTIDVFAVGRTLEVEGDSKERKIVRREFKEHISHDERLKRVRAVVMALVQMGDFAKQARNAVSFAPDILFGAVAPAYTQRGLRSLEVLADHRLDTAALKVVAADLSAVGAVLYAALTPGVIANDSEFIETCRAAGATVGTPVETLKALAAGIA